MFSLCFLFMLLLQLILLFLIQVGYGPLDFFEVFWYRSLPSVIYTTLVAPFVLMMIRNVMKESLKQYNLF